MIYRILRIQILHRGNHERTKIKMAKRRLLFKDNFAKLGYMKTNISISYSLAELDYTW